MANLDQNTRINTGFFHSLGKVLTKDTNTPANEKYKSSHNIQTSEVWTDQINYCPGFMEAETEATNNPALTQIGTISSLARLYPLKDSNNQTWFLDTGSPAWDNTGYLPSSGWVKPFISPVDIVDSTGAPSLGLQFKLYDDSGVNISPLNGRWEVDYYAGFLKFAVNFTPQDSGNGLGINNYSLSGLIAAPDRDVYLDTNGPKAIAFYYTGQTLDSYLDNLPGGSVEVGGGQEWQDSVLGYLATVGIDANINGDMTVDGQVTYLNSTYDSYYIYASTVGSNSYGLSNSTWYSYNGSTFSEYTLSDNDDSNRFLKVENSITLDVATPSGTAGSYSVMSNHTVNKYHIMEYVDSTVTGLTQSVWLITNPRTGMVTTVDQLANRMTRYTGSSNGWVEYSMQSTYKVNSQRDITCELTQVDYDVALDGLVDYEPAGLESIEIYVNGINTWSEGYRFAKPSSYDTIAPTTIIGSNSISVPTSGAPSASQYLRFTNGVDTHYRKVTNITASGSNSIIDYSGYDVPSYSNLSKFSVNVRGIREGREGDLLLWVGSVVEYELNNEDSISLNYITNDSNAL